MDRMIVIVFDDESKAYKGAKTLNQLDSEGSISVHAGAVVKKNADGTVSIAQTVGDFPIRTVSGTAIGSLIGLLGGPIGFGIGAATGTVAGSLFDLYRAGINADFLYEVSAILIPRTWAVVADISEEWVTPVDTTMETLGGIIFRVARWSVEDEQDRRAVAMLKEDIALLKAEIAQSRAEHKAKLQAKVDNLEKKMQAKLDNVKQRSEQRKKEAEAKVQALKKKASKAKGEVKAKIEKWIADIKESDDLASKEYDEWFANYRDLAD